jgi:hypothetical protein
LDGLEEDPDALMADRAFIEQTVLPALLSQDGPPQSAIHNPQSTIHYDRLLVNGPCYVKGAEAIEPEFKRLMFAEEA